MDVRVSKIRTHQGNMLLVAARQYPTVHLAMLEVVQNAIDSGAKNISVMVNQPKRSFTILDDGTGASQADFDEALMQVGSSLKVGKKDKFGRFGLGLVSSLGKCDRFTFTSNKRGTNVFNMWTFETEKIKRQQNDIEIPCQQLSQYRRGRTSKSLTIEGQKVQQVHWSSRFTVAGYTTDKTVAKLLSPTQFAEEVFDRFGTVMLKRGTKLTLVYTLADGTVEEHKNLQPSEYQGEKLPREVVYNSGVRTYFDIWLTHRGQGKRRRADVYLLDTQNPFRLPFRLFVESVKDLLDAEVIKALKSGYFTGEISNPTIQLHENRKEFVRNDNLIAFCNAIEEWYIEHGSKHYDELKSAESDERLQRLGLESIQTLKAMMQLPQYELLAERLQQFQMGTHGKHHVPPNPEAEAGLQEHRSLRAGSDTSGEDDANNESSSAKRKSPPKPKDNDTPLTVAGPKGQRRKVVKDDSFGLQFCHEMMPGESRLWVLDDEQGILYFNRRHPAWQMCESAGTSDARLKRLMEQVAVMALHSLLLPEEWRHQFDDHLEAVAEGQAFLLAHSPSFNHGKKLPK